MLYIADFLHPNGTLGRKRRGPHRGVWGGEAESAGGEI